MSLQSPQSRDSGRRSAKRPTTRWTNTVNRKKTLWRYATLSIALVAFLLLAWLLWQWANNQSGVRREVPKQQMIIPLPPPPPEPEEQPEPPPEPEQRVEPEPEPEPTPVEEPTPEEPPSPADDLAEAMQIDGEAQAGNDAFNIAAGGGSGMAGSGAGRIGNATYGQYLSYAFQKILREDEAIRHLSYRVRVNLWLDRDGQVTRVELLKSSGDQDVDEKIIAALRGTTALDQKPPPSLTLPVRMSLQGRRPG
ncbi:energy transducer TonB (plasmid) [Alcanivorax sp. N3-2A]|nr:energy transducer TonB [Alcanivorax sp. N3-2A]ASK36733.1 energy transducer TonB [Alcanivorax sp. N3-2A]